MIQVTRAIRGDTSISALKGIKEQPLVNICSTSMEANNLALKHFFDVEVMSKQTGLRFFLLKNLNLFLTLANTSQADPIRAKLLPRTMRP